MPIYEFQCSSCHQIFSKLCSLGEDGRNIDCPACKQKTVNKMFSTFATANASGGSSLPKSSASSGCSPKSPFR